MGWKQLFHIFWTFCKMSPVTFGGGYAMIPLIEREVIEKNKWLTREDVTDALAVSQSIPGAVAVNSAMFIGQRIGGVRGAVAAMLGISLPSFFVVLALGVAYSIMQDHPKVEAAFLAIRASIVALIVYAAIKVGKTAVIDKPTLVLFIIGAVALFFIHPVLVLIIGAISGIILSRFKERSCSTEQQKEPIHDLDYFMGAGI